ncbi:hypothetical protein A3F03_03645 [Candidatus Roizmanbacteria bacterium RIFCSPHIGHO2_12_FULL_41_11]|uniref:Glycosyltransferase 2-like domain-containing protein n=2 Tax=Candidatus Roizmaniibacteriota TaxID=1752723 RepID=A0A1F7J860_9BACT|nr:MAG: hypothetical protein A3F03_03645 [Candidatus Roizmanbacteria bacterium RIFCSPHIGHO2_12_FULL_41_11]OGK51800.1 MAG: hypothetical protein A2966_04025 [Candidatus Roizmanbacteria bacterium RIFCSPLOWO2_01_FULL_41_22]
MSVDSHSLLTFFIILLSLIFSLQGIFTLVWMLYAWEDPDYVKQHKSPEEFTSQKFSFTALIPAKNEEKVIQDTIKAVNKISYPDELKETLVLCRIGDEGTIAKAQGAIREINKKNVRLILFNSYPINKPHALNNGLKEAKKEIVTVFDAEDQPHPDIYNIANTLLVREKVDVIQSGIQLINYRSHWFSALNVMEYFFWFKSGLHFFSKFGKVIPLGGNTVFIKRNWLEKIGGWDENCLTEDADIGFRLTKIGAKTRVIYDEKHTTQEETPVDIASFIKQRTRWNQGFLQIFLKNEWSKLPKTRQKITAVYVLLSHQIQTFFLLYIPFAIWFAFTQKMPIIVSLFSFVPFFLFLLQIVTFIVGFYEFTKAYKQKFTFWMLIKIIITFYPFQLLLMISSFRALYRVIFSQNAWDKTLHTNAHRGMVGVSIT